MIDDLTLQNQIRDLALASRSEPTDGWRTEELDPKLWNGWRKMIQGDRLEIAEYDLTAKVSQGDSPSPESVTIPPAPSTAPINIPRCLPTAPPIDANDAQSQ